MVTKPLWTRLTTWKKKNMSLIKIKLFAKIQRLPVSFKISLISKRVKPIIYTYATEVSMREL